MCKLEDVNVVNHCSATPLARKYLLGFWYIRLNTASKRLLGCRVVGTIVNESTFAL